jgi:hypothetical protein
MFLLTPEQHRNQAELLRHSKNPEARRRAAVHEQIAAAIERRSTESLAGDKEWNEADHPRGQPGNAGQFGSGGGGGSSKPARPAAASRGAYAGQYVTSGESPRANHHLTVERVLTNPPNRGIHYRRMLAHLIREAPQHGGDRGQIAALKRRLIASLDATVAAETARGRTTEAARAQASADRLRASLEGMARTTNPALQRQPGQPTVQELIARQRAQSTTPAAPKPGSHLDKLSTGKKLEAKYRSDADAVRIYEQHIKEDPDEFAKNMLAGMAEHATGTTVTASRYSPNTLTFRTNFNGGGSMTREINFQTGEVDHAYLVIPKEQRKAGKSILASQIATYQKLGLKAVQVHANIDVGAYAWAKYGFVPKQSSWDELRRDLGHRLAAIERGSSTVKKEDIAAMKGLLAKSDPKTIWKVVDHKGTVQVGGKDTTIAKVLMTGPAAPHWYGKLDLGNKEVMNRFHSYVGKDA